MRELKLAYFSEHVLEKGELIPSAAMLMAPQHPRHPHLPPWASPVISVPANIPLEKFSPQPIYILQSKIFHLMI